MGILGACRNGTSSATRSDGGDARSPTIADGGSSDRPVDVAPDLSTSPDGGAPDGDALDDASTLDSKAVQSSDAGFLVGAEGGTFTTADDVTIEIPAGALTSSVLIRVTPAPNAVVPAGATLVGPAYSLSPDGTQFQKPVVLTLPFDPTKLPTGTTESDVVVYTAPAGSSSYTALIAGPADPTHLRAETTHFSTVLDAVLGCGMTLMGCPPTNTQGGGPNGTCFIYWGCGGNGWCSPLCSGDCNGFCDSSGGSGTPPRVPVACCAGPAASGPFDGTWTGQMNYQVGCQASGLPTTFVLTQHDNGCIDGVWDPPSPNSLGGIPSQRIALNGFTNGSSVTLTSASYGCDGTSPPQPLGITIATASSQSLTFTLTGYGCSCSSTTPLSVPISGTFYAHQRLRRRWLSRYGYLLFASRLLPSEFLPSCEPGHSERKRVRNCVALNITEESSACPLALRPRRVILPR